MRIDDKIRNEILRYDVNKEAAKTSALSSGKIDKYKYLILKQIVPSDLSLYIFSARKHLKKKKINWRPKNKTSLKL